MHTALGHRARFAVLGATNLTSCYRTACCVCVFDRGGGRGQRFPLRGRPFPPVEDDFPPRGPPFGNFLWMPLMLYSTSRPVRPDELLSW